MKIAVIGALGKMGIEIIQDIAKHPELELSYAILKNNHISLNKQVKDFITSIKSEINFTNDAEQAVKNSDIIVDFSSADNLIKTALLCKKYNKPLVSGVTGINDKQLLELNDIAKSIAILYSANMSLGVSILAQVVENVASILKDKFDIEIFDIHHKEKKDAPSGTSLMLGKAAAKGLGLDFNEIKNFNRNNSHQRKKNEIGFASMRGGMVAGEHKVMFLGDSESIEFGHIAYNRAIFAQGAVIAAIWLFKNKHTPGFYKMQDVFK